MEGSAKEQRFIHWIFKRIIRVYTPLIVYYSILIWDGSLKIETFGDLFNAFAHSPRWFCNFIILIYVILYIINKIRNSNHRDIDMKVILAVLAVIYMIVFVIIGKGEAYPTYSITSKMLWIAMALIGWYIYEYKPTVAEGTKAILIIAGLFIMYAISKYLNTRKLFYGASLLPFLFGGAFSIYFLISLMNKEELCTKICNKKILGNFISTISELSLEIYIIQFAVIYKYMNRTFPVNIIIIVTTILLMALILHAVSNYIIKKLFV